MLLSYNLLLFALTFIGGSIPIWIKPISDARMHYLLAFSGSFLLSITFLHLMPEGFEALGSKAGVYLLAGFFLQLIIQRLTHGVEHGHAHIEQATHHHIPMTTVVLGLCLHALMEGFPLGFHYADRSTATSLYLAVAAHKLPEAMLAATLVMHTQSKSRAVIFLLLFSLVTPIGSYIANFMSTQLSVAQRFVTVLLPLVAGAFIHIATTIFFESGTKQHALTWQKTLAIIAGLLLGLTTLMFE